MRRLYFLLPDTRVTHKVVDELLLARVAEKHRHGSLARWHDRYGCQ